MADYDWLILLIVGGAVAVALVLLYATRTGRRKKKTPPEPIVMEARDNWLTRALNKDRTVTDDDAKKAKDELKALDLEREILSYAIRRLYEAQAEGKITEEEREQLASWYKSRMLKVRDNIARSESVVALNELESMQEDLVKLFSDRFDELGKKVEELRSQLQLKKKEEEALVPTIEEEESESEPETGEVEKEKKKPRKKPAPKEAPQKTGAEKRIDEIRAEVEKVLERLGQIEVEGEG